MRDEPAAANENGGAAETGVEGEVEEGGPGIFGRNVFSRSVSQQNLFIYRAPTLVRAIRCRTRCSFIVLWLRLRVCLFVGVVEVAR